MSSAAVDREPCAACNGSGVRETRGGRLEAGTYQPCPTCRGYGHVQDDESARSQALRTGLLGLILLVVIGAAVLFVVVN